jgi:hypothetical protein
LNSVWRSPAIKVSHGVTLNLSLMNSAATPPFTPMEEAGKFGVPSVKSLFEVVVLVLAESVDAGLKIVLPEVCVEGCLRASVLASG